MTDIRSITETEADLRAQVRSLENECRALKETLRDRFAMAALTGLLAGKCNAVVSTISGRGWPVHAERDAWLIADAMLSARNAAISRPAQEQT